MNLNTLLFSTFLLFSMLCSKSILAQTEAEATEALKNITSLDQLDSLKSAHPSWMISIHKTLEEGITANPKLTTAEVGSFVQTQYSDKAPKLQHKIIKKGTEDACRVKYIYLDGTKHKTKEITKIRKKILQEQEEGTPFQVLVEKYNEDGNPTGELNWFYTGMMVDVFDEAVRNRDAGDIFTVDVVKNNWYYVVWKPEANRMMECTYSISIRIQNSN